MIEEQTFLTSVLHWCFSFLALKRCLSFDSRGSRLLPICTGNGLLENWETFACFLWVWGVEGWRCWKMLKMFLALMSSISNLSFMNSSRRLLSFSLSTLISFLSFFQLVKSFISSSATASMLRPLVQMVTPGKGRLVTGLAASFKLVVTKFSCQLL